jgi:hypothetical protein
VNDQMKEMKKARRSIVTGPFVRFDPMEMVSKAVYGKGLILPAAHANTKLFEETTKYKQLGHLHDVGDFVFFPDAISYPTLTDFNREQKERGDNRIFATHYGEHEGQKGYFVYVKRDHAGSWIAKGKWPAWTDPTLSAGEAAE